MTARKQGARKKGKDYRFNEFPIGRGKLKCELCGLPLRDHKMDTHHDAVRGRTDA